MLFFLLFMLSTPQETISFKSVDSLQISADLYITHPKTAPFIVLFHQAGFSRGEYHEIAPELNKMGFNCMAIDLRSGHDVNGIDNLTAKRAREKEWGTSYLDAIPDILAAVEYAKIHFAGGTLIIWGSSYSAALVLYLAGQHTHLADAVLSFSPGEYFEDAGKPSDFIQCSANHIAIPTFITSASNEKAYWQAIFESITAQKQSFVPSGKGIHGSRALWQSTPEHAEYWEAVKKFLTQFR
jgi:dienelactone hydrolase